MSVLVTMKVQGDTSKFREFAQSHPDKLEAISADARQRGCMHHRFGVGDGFMVVIDEWETAEQFRSFFEGNEQIAEVMQTAGAQGEPEFVFSEALPTSDEF